MRWSLPSHPNPPTRALSTTRLSMTESDGWQPKLDRHAAVPATLQQQLDLLELPHPVLVHHLDDVVGRRNNQPLLHLCYASLRAMGMEREEGKEGRGKRGQWQQQVCESRMVQRLPHFLQTAQLQSALCDGSCLFGCCEVSATALIGLQACCVK